MCSDLWSALHCIGPGIPAEPSVLLAAGDMSGNVHLGCRMIAAFIASQDAPGKGRKGRADGAVGRGLVGSSHDRPSSGAQEAISARTASQPVQLGCILHRGRLLHGCLCPGGRARQPEALHIICQGCLGACAPQTSELVLTKRWKAVAMLMRCQSVTFNVRHWM